MAPIRYSLHYEDYSEHLMSRFGKLLQMQSFVDMTLMCSSHTLRVHKVILAASSTYFQEVLEKQTGEPLIILKMRFSVLKCLVEFMYCGKTQCLEENLDELVSAAQFLQIKGLSKVTKEGLGITNNRELPIFTPPVVISRPPQSLIDLPQDVIDPKTSQAALTAGASQPDALGRTNGNKDMVVRIPFDIEKGIHNADYTNTLRSVRPRRGRPSQRAAAWDPSAALRPPDRPPARRDDDARKTGKHSRHSQDYMDRMTLTQAVNSICGPEAGGGYMSMDNDFMYMDQTVSNSLDRISYANDSSDPAGFATSSTNDSANGAGTSMSQYVSALKNAGLPTDLPILFESGDGSYINVNEQVFLDMVQSREIKYEVIDQPSLMETVADPGEIKSIDELSKSIERGEMLIGKDYNPAPFNKEPAEFRHEDAISSLSAILPDNLETFNEQQNFVVLDSQYPGGMDSVTADFSCIDGDMQFFTKSMSDDIKKYYEAQQLDDPAFCPTSTALDTNYSSQTSDMNQQFSSLNHDLRRNDEDCFTDFGLPQPSVFKDTSLDCLMSTPKRTEDKPFDMSNQLDSAAKEQEEIINDLMNIEKNLMQTESMSDKSGALGSAVEDPIREFGVDSLGDVFAPADERAAGAAWGGRGAGEAAADEPVVDLTGAGEGVQGARDAEDRPDRGEGPLDDIPFAVGLRPAGAEPPGAAPKRRPPHELDSLESMDASCLKRKVKYKKM